MELLRHTAGRSHLRSFVFHEVIIFWLLIYLGFECFQACGLVYIYKGMQPLPISTRSPSTPFPTRNTSSFRLREKRKGKFSNVVMNIMNWVPNILNWSVLIFNYRCGCWSLWKEKEIKWTLTRIHSIEKRVLRFFGSKLGQFGVRLNNDSCGPSSGMLVSWLKT